MEEREVLSSSKNSVILKTVDDIIISDLKIKAGLNKKQEIKRLLFKIFKKYKLSRKKFLQSKEIKTAGHIIYIDAVKSQ